MANQKIKEKYVSLDRAAEALHLSVSQLNQYLITGQLIASIIYHKPADYIERREVALSDGSKALHTKTNRTMISIVAPEHKINPLTYLHPDDTARILLNKTPNREMLVSRLFYDLTLTPKKGIGLFGESSITVSPIDLVISSDELYRFAKAAKIKIKPNISKVIELPPKHWYDRPLGRTGLAIFGTLIAGVIIMWVKGEL